jgi:CheY-like chemotaxis protein
MPTPLLPSASLRPHHLAALKVLVVDDNANVQRLIADVLRAGGVGQVECAGDGLKAREMLARWDPHIVFSDWVMPHMDGLEFTRSIRRAAVEPDPKVPNPHVPVIIVTGHRSERDVEVARLAGVNEFVIKPFTPASLLSRIQLVLSKPRPFIVSEAYIGPDRRRKTEITYAGQMRRMSDPDEVVDAIEREAARDTISVELDAMVEKVSNLVVEYADGMGGPEFCQAEVLDLHFEAIRTLLELKPDDAPLAKQIVTRLDEAVKKKIEKRRAA